MIFSRKYKREKQTLVQGRQLQQS